MPLITPLPDPGRPWAEDEAGRALWGVERRDRDTAPSIPVTGGAEGGAPPSSSGYPDIGPQMHTSDPFPSLRFPGMGERGSDMCGQIRYHAVCPVNPEHFKRPIPNSCGHVTCPVCWGNWAARAAERIDAQVRGYQRAHSGQSTFQVRKRRIPHPRHVVLSPAPEKVEAWLEAAKGDFDAFKKRFWSWGRKQFGILGLDGAAVVPHYYRLKSKVVADEAAALAKTANTNRYRAPLPVIDSGDSEWSDWFKFSPHFHFIAYGYVRINSKAYEAVTGDMYTVIRAKGKGVTNIAGLAYYLLTHTSVYGLGTRAVTYWGCLSARYLKKTEHWTLEDVVCPICGEQLYEAVEDVNGNWHFREDKPLQRKRYTPWFDLRAIYEPPKLSGRMSGRFRAALVSEEVRF